MINMTWDKPKPKLEDLTKEQLIAHCEREAAWHRVFGRDSDDELKEHIEKLKREVYNQGYILDKIWLSLVDHGGLDSKTMVTENPSPVVNAFFRILGKLKAAELKLAASEYTHYLQDIGLPHIAACGIENPKDSNDTWLSTVLRPVNCPGCLLKKPGADAK